MIHQSKETVFFIIIIITKITWHIEVAKGTPL